MRPLIAWSNDGRSKRQQLLDELKGLQKGLTPAEVAWVTVIALAVFLLTALLMGVR